MPCTCVPFADPPSDTAGRRRRALLLAGLATLLVAGTAGAEVRRIEAVGVVPLRAGSGTAGAVDAAIQAALEEAVTRVARSFLMDVEPAESGEAQEPDLEKVLGDRMVPYTTRFKVLDDKGLRPAMFADAPRVKSEYVVVVEVFVDADRVQQRLIDAGLLRRDPLADAVDRVTLEVRGLDAYGAYAAVRALIVERCGARTAVPLQFDRGVAVLAVDLPLDAGGAGPLVDQLVALGPPQLRVRPLEVEEGRAVVSVEWTSPPDARDR